MITNHLSKASLYLSVALLFCLQAGSFASSVNGDEKSLSVRLVGFDEHATFLTESGVVFDRVKTLDGIDISGAGIIVVAGDKENIAWLASNSDVVRKWCTAGSWVMIAGLEQDALASFNKLVGFDQIMRPFRVEAVEVSRGRQSLFALERSALKLYSKTTLPENISARSGTVFTHVLYGADVASFADITNADQLKTVNGLTTKDSEEYISYMRAPDVALPAGKTEKDFAKYPALWTYKLRKPETITGISLCIGNAYRYIKELKVIINGQEKTAFILKLKQSNLRQNFDLPAGLANVMIKTITLQAVSTIMPDLTAKEKKRRDKINDLMPLCSIDSVWFWRNISDTEKAKVVPLTSPAGIVNYPIGKGGIVLNQIDIINDDGLDFEPRWSRNTGYNGKKKKLAVYSTLLEDMGADVANEQVGAIGFVSAPVSESLGEYQELARVIYKATEIKGGMVVHVGSRDGKLSAALRANDSYVVQGLECDDKLLAQSREYLTSLGVYGKVSCIKWDGKSLPYMDNLVNLLVIEDRKDLTDEQIMRVLAPLGVAYERLGATWRKIQKPWPDEIDEWTHYLHGADKNAVANDTRVGFPRSMQWTVTDPLFMRTHNGDSGFSAMVSTKGRVFYIIDEGPTGFLDKRLPAKWALIARDAFNGKLLWKRRITDWGWQSRNAFKFSRNRLVTPSTPPERLVAIGERVYVTPGIHAAVCEIDASSGKILRTFDNTAGTMSILLHEGTMVLTKLKLLLDPLVKYRDAVREEGEIIAIDIKTGKRLWTKKTATYEVLSTAVSGDYVVYRDRNNLICLNLTDGKERWKSPDTQSRGVTIVATPKVILTAGRDNLQAYSTKDGAKIWAGDPDAKVRGACGARPDVYVIGNVAWVGKSPVKYDLLTGKVLNKINAALIHSHGHHYRCYRDKATVKFILGAKRGIEFLDLDGDDHARHDWARGPCRYGVMPANGLIYTPPHQCVCYSASLLLGMNALSTARKPLQTSTGEPANRLQTGSAFDKPIVKTTAKNGNWPTYRSDAKRSGAVETQIPEKLQIAWKHKFNTKISAPVCTGGKIYLSLPDKHQVACIDSKSGKLVWRFFAGARIDSPPTIWGGRAVFGSADGWLYCLDAADGKLAWKFKAAPDNKMVGVDSQLESAWPVHGTPLLIDNVIYFLAGRSSFLDGGIQMFALDIQSGKMLHSTKLSGPHRKASGGLDFNQGKGEATSIDGARTDILVYDGGYIYLRNRKFDRKLVEYKVANASASGDKVIGLHLMANSYMLDGSGFARQRWTYGKRWTGQYPATYAAKTGSLIAFDEKFAYVAKPYPIDGGHGEGYKQKEGCLLLADDIDNEPLAGATSLRLGFYAGHKGMKRAKAPKWSDYHKIWINAMVVSRDKLIIAGPPDEIPFDDPLASHEGRNGGLVQLLSKKTGKVLVEYKLDSPPIFDGMIAADGCLYVSTADGTLLRIASER